MNILGQRVWAEIDIDNILHNYRQIRLMAQGIDIMPVVKADAYGHGIGPVVQELSKAGVKMFAVATADEAMELRRGITDSSILILGAVPIERLPQLARADIAICLPSVTYAKRCAGALHGASIKAHIKIDSGMARLGLDAPTACDEIKELLKLPCFQIEGVFTHLAAAGDMELDDYTAGQLNRFRFIVDCLEKDGVHIRYVHCANSQAMLRHPDSYFNLVRPGILLFGCGLRSVSGRDFRPVLSLRAVISQVRWIPAGQAVGYGLKWTARRRTRIAVVSAGYADGVLRSASGKLEVLIHGHIARQIGGICMDMFMIDVTEVNDANPGDVVTIIGADGMERITAEKYASFGSSICYEALCCISKRVPRYYEGAKGISVAGGCSVQYQKICTELPGVWSRAYGSPHHSDRKMTGDIFTSGI